MLTKLLHICGLYLGPENELMPAQADNPDGFWEHLGFVAMNDELLNELGGAWDLPPKADENFKHPRLDLLRTKARLLVEGFDSATVWGWKDPRNSLTLPFWQDLLPKLEQSSSCVIRLKSLTRCGSGTERLIRLVCGFGKSTTGA